jgi:sugar phosphate isomerase/epimerase
LKQFGDPRVGILLDPGNFLEMGETSIPQTWLGRVGLVHIKDYDPDQKKFAPLGQGGVDFAAYFRALQRHGCDTLGVSLETHCPGDKLGSTQASLDALRRLLKSLGIAEG